MLQTRKGDGPYEFSQGHSRMTLASGGGLYVSGLLRVIEFDSAGVPVVNPETGCYAVLRKSKADPTLRVARIYADSALVFTRDTDQTNVGRRTTTVMYSGANRVSLHPLRRVSGEPCAGMLESVGPL